ncbi:MAG TPA: glycosyltransferase family 4 protein [Longimicrobiales bacterium]
MRRGLRIGYLVQQFPPEIGAGPARAAELARRWRDAGAEVTVITAMPNRPIGRIHPDYRRKLAIVEDWEGIRVLRSWLYASPKHGFVRTVLNNTSFAVTGALHGLARAGGLDVLIASSPPFFVHLAGELVSRVRGIPMVLEVRDLWPDYLVGMNVIRSPRLAAWLFALERHLFRRAAHIVAVTEPFREMIQRKGVDADRIDVIPNGVDSRLYYAERSVPPVPELQRRGGEVVVGYLGNFGAGQGLATVIEAAALLEREGAPFRFVLAGGGPEAAKVAELARGVSTVAVLDPIPKDQTRAFYNACDVCLVPLAPVPVLQETIPSKLFEILACERPVLASLGGEGARVVRESGAGLVVPPGDPVALAAGLKQLAAMPEGDRREMGRRGRAYATLHHERDALAGRYLDLLDRVAGQRRAVTDSGRFREAS